jgi:putative transposase
MSAVHRRVYDHRLRNLVAISGPNAVNDVVLPRSTVATCKKRGYLAVVSSVAFEETELELSVRVAQLVRRLAVLRGILRLLLALVRVRRARLTDDRLPQGNDKQRVLRAIDRAVKVVPRWLALSAVGLTEARLRRWKQRAALCLLDDRSPCPKRQPSRLTFNEEQTMQDLVESIELRHFSIRALMMHARRTAVLFASESTWWRTIRDKGWLRPKQRVHPESPKLGIRASEVGELIHVDVTVIRLLDKWRWLGRTR